MVYPYLSYRLIIYNQEIKFKIYNIILIILLQIINESL